MATPFKNGQEHIIDSLEAWEELGYSSMREASEALGTNIMGELAHAREMAQNENNSPQAQKGWEEHIEFFKGMLSRLD